jgi:hypothetical protein
MNPTDPVSARRADLHRALFSEVAPADWKAPISVVVPRDMAGLYSAAVAFMTATVPEVLDTGDPGRVRLVAPGYRMGPAGP